MIDAHCHLHLLLKRTTLPVVEERARSVGVDRIVSCSCSVTDWDTQLTSDPFVLHQFGVHPWWAAESRPTDWLDRLRELLHAHPSAGVGEIGLDKNKKSTVPFPTQVDTFVAQLRIAKQLDRPCSVHCVNEYGPLMDILKAEKVTTPVVIHSFSGSGDSVGQLLRVAPDTYFSASGQCPRAEVIPFIPRDRILIETDSPDQPMTGVSADGVPPPIADGVNDPSQLLHVAERVAIALSVDVAEVISITRANTMRAFRIPPT